MFSWFRKKSASAAPMSAAVETPSAVDRSRTVRLEGNACLERGDPAAAAERYAEAAALDPGSADAQVNLGFALLELGRHAAAQLPLAEAIRLAPDSHDAYYLLGSALRGVGQRDPAIVAWRRALVLQPSFDHCRRDLAQALVEAGEVAEAEATLAEGIDSNPGFVDFHYYCGNIHAGRGDPARAVECYVRALALRPDYAQVHQAMGEALKAQGDIEAAIESHRRSVALNPASADARARLAAALHDHSELEASVSVYRQALALDASHAEVYVNMGYALRQLEQKAEAEASYRKAIELRPDFAGAHTSLGDLLTEQGKLDEAVSSYRRALALAPQDSRAHNNLAGALLGQGRLEDAVEGFEQALALFPGYISAFSNKLFALNYHPDKSAEEIFEAYREFDRRFGLPLRGAATAHANDRNTDRPLRIGYVSPDFRRHVASHFVMPLFVHRDRSAMQVYAYSNLITGDEVTESFRRSADHWIPIPGMSDEEVADRIRADGIDILVDLAGHTGNNRLGVFARKPAPVSLSWLGYGYTTGLTAIDYFLTDAVSAPDGCEALFSERPWRIATPAYVYRPPEGMGDPGTLPVERKGCISFGTLTRAIRVNPHVVRVWSEILRRVEDARLIVDSINFQDASMQESMAAQFVAQGIARERLEIGFHTPPWELLRSVDIGLDCFPHNSGTTLCESLYLGVPYVTLAGRPSVGRLGSSLLHGVGHAEWIAQSEEEYIAKAVALASDRARLAELRRGLRAEMQTSPLMDEPGFVRKVEAAYREMFARWAAEPGAWPTQTGASSPVAELPDGAQGKPLP